MIRKITQTIQKYSLIREKEHILVGVSGGPDSVCLLMVLRELAREMKWKISVAHFNHMLRGEESDKDEAFVSHLAQSLEFPYVSEKGDVSGYQKEHGGSMEEVARDLRYRFFRAQAEKLSADKIAVGHHAEDQAETVLMRMIRGAGARGLSGILPLREELIIRPLLFVTREEIETYLKENNIDYREDSSNLETDKMRNRIRHELVPLLKERFNPGIVDSLTRNAEIVRDEEAFLQKYTYDVYLESAEESVPAKVVLRKDALRRLEPAIRRRVIRLGVELVKSDLRSLSFSHLEDALDLLEKRVAGKSLDWPGGIRIVFSYDTVTITSDEKKIPEGEETTLSVPGEVSFQGKRIVSVLVDAKEWSRGEEKVKDTIWMDGEKVAPPFLVRSRHPGDRFQPLGMKSEKKLKEFFIDRKIPSDERDHIPLLISEGKIVCLGGVELSETVKITDKTREAIKITMK